MGDTHTVDHRGDGQVAVANDQTTLELSDARICTEQLVTNSEVTNTGESQNAKIQSAPLESVSISSPAPTADITTKLSAPTSREGLHSSTQEVIEEINAKRKQDTQILADFKKAMEMQVNKMCNLVEQQMFRTYDREGKNIQAKLTELFATLDRIAQIETELQQFKQALQILYQEMQHGQ